MSTPLKIAHSDFTNNQIVIQCPACQTRFSVDSALLDSVTEAKFHCSHCDHLFSRNGDGSTLQAAKKDSATVSSPSSASSDDGVVAIYRDPPKVQAVPRATATPPKPLEIPKRWDTTIQSTPPRETSEPPAQVAFQFSEGAKEKEKEAAPKQKETRVQFAKSIADDTIDIPSFGAVKTAPLVDDGRSTTMPSEAIKTPVAPKPLTPARDPEPVSMWYCLALPTGAFLLFLLGVALLFQFDGNLASSFMAAAVPGAITPASPDLFVKNTQFQKVTLDSGETVRVVTGTIVNGTESAFRAVELQGVLFDNTGKPIGTVTVNAASTLAKSKIHALTPEMIQDLQSDANSRRLMLHPGESRDFALAFIGSEYAAATNFGARVYSAKAS